MRAIIRFAAISLASSAIATSLVAMSSLSASAAVIISAASTQHMNCVGGVCTPTAKDAVLNVNDLTSMLANGSVEVTTGSGSLAAKVEDIDVAAGFSWSGANSLTLDAYRSITFRKGAVVVNGTGAVAFVTNDGGSNGTLSFQLGANLSFASTTNNLTINGTAFALENSIATLASAIAANPAGNFALANSYDASHDGKYHNSPIVTTLQGTVEGLGNTISNLSISAGPTKSNQSGVGLFSNVGEAATVANMALTNLQYRVSKTSTYVGGLIGVDYGFVANDYVSGSIIEGDANSKKWAPPGGLVGKNWGTIASSHASVSVRAEAPSQTAGGLVGLNWGTITLSSADGSVRGAEFGGGLVGINGGTIEECFASGVVGSDLGGGALGGLVGQDENLIRNSYATGSVRNGAGMQLGGLIGITTGGYYDDSFATGRISYGQYTIFGGFVGGVFGTFEVMSSYWNTTTAKTTQGVGYDPFTQFTPPVGLTSAQLRSGLPVGFDPTIWAEKKGVNHGFPYLINNPPPKD